MSTLQEQYQQLLKDLKQHITEEYLAGSWISSNDENFAYFKNYALQKKKNLAEHKKQLAEVKPLPAASLDKPEIKLSEPEVKARATPIAVADSSLTQGRPAAKAYQAATDKALEASTAPAIKDIEKITKDQNPTLFKRESMQPSIEGDFSDIRQFFAKKFPHITLHQAPPKDTAAKAFINQWQKPPAEAKVLILSFNENAKEKLFLSNLKHALELEFGSAAIYAADKAEKQARWKELLASKQLALIIAHKGKMEALSGLMANYREEPVPMLGKVRTYPLCDISLYMQQPSLKKDLWLALSTFLPKL